MPELENGITTMVEDNANLIVSLIEEDQSEKVKELLSSFSYAEQNEILKLVKPEVRSEALLSLGKEEALKLIVATSDDPDENFMREIQGEQTSVILERLYDKDDRTAVVDLPPFVLQKMLVHGDDRAREIIEDSIAYLVESKQLALLKSILIELNPVDIASILDDFKPDDLRKIYRLLPKDMATDVFVYLPPEISQNLLITLSDTEAGALIDDLYADDAVDLLDEMPSIVVKKLLAKAKPETRAVINQLLQYQEDSAGSIMTVEFVDLKEFDTVETAIAKIREWA